MPRISHPERYLPQGSRLDIDRRRTAQTVVLDINRWKDRTNRVDLKGYDTKREERSTGFSGADEFRDEPYRFLQGNQLTRQLLDEMKEQFVDYQSFVEALKNKWRSDPSLRNLIDNAEASGDPNVYKPLFETAQVQEWLRRNVREIGIKGLEAERGLSRTQAKAIWDDLSQRQRMTLITTIIAGGDFRLPREPRITRQPRAPRLPQIRQRSASGRTYSRSKPKKFTRFETQFIRNNLNVPLKRLWQRHTQIFTRTPRTMRSIKEKRLRIARQAR